MEFQNEDIAISAVLAVVIYVTVSYSWRRILKLVFFGVKGFFAFIVAAGIVSGVRRLQTSE